MVIEVLINSRLFFYQLWIPPSKNLEEFSIEGTSLEVSIFQLLFLFIALICYKLLVVSNIICYDEQQAFLSRNDFFLILFVNLELNYKIKIYYK